MAFLGCSVLLLVYSVATVIWAVRTQVGRERERYTLQGSIMAVVGIGLTIAAVYELLH